MRKLLLAVLFSLGVSATANAIEVVTVQGPVEVLTTTSTVPSSESYTIIGNDGVRYRVLLPDSERARLATVLKQYPSTVIRFDGAVVGGGTVPTFNAQKWETVTTTTTTTVTENGDKIVSKTTKVTK